MQRDFRTSTEVSTSMRQTSPRLAKACFQHDYQNPNSKASQSNHELSKPRRGKPRSGSAAGFPHQCLESSSSSSSSGAASCHCPCRCPCSPPPCSSTPGTPGSNLLHHGSSCPSHPGTPRSPTSNCPHSPDAQSWRNRSSVDHGLAWEHSSKESFPKVQIASEVSTPWM